MALTTCSECGHTLSTTASACPNCGASARSGWDTALRWFGGTIAVLFVIGLIGSIMENATARSTPSSTSSSRATGSGLTGSATGGATSGTTSGATGGTARGATGRDTQRLQPLADWRALQSARSARSPQPSAQAPPATTRPSTPPRTTSAAATDLCRDYRTQLRVDSMARVIARQNMRFADGPHGRTVDCVSYSAEGIARMDLVVNWEGNGRTPYWVRGTLELTPSGSRWTPSTASETLREVNRNWDQVKAWGIGLAIVGAAVAAAMASSSSSEASTTRSRTGTAVACLQNRFNHTLRYQHRWANDAAWVSDSLAPGARNRHTSHGRDTLQIRYDYRLNDGEVTWRARSLPGIRVQATTGRDATSTGPACRPGSNFDLSVTADTIEVRYQ